MERTRKMTHATETSSLADLLERVLDKGIVIAGDIKIKLCDIELLTIQIRLMVASVDKAKEMGLDWWTQNPQFSSRAHAALPPGPMAPPALPPHEELSMLRQRIAELERQTAPMAVPA